MKRHMEKRGFRVWNPLFGLRENERYSVQAYVIKRRLV